MTLCIETQIKKLAEYMGYMQELKCNSAMKCRAQGSLVHLPHLHLCMFKSALKLQPDKRTCTLAAKTQF